MVKKQYIEPSNKDWRLFMEEFSRTGNLMQSCKKFNLSPDRATYLISTLKPQQAVQQIKHVMDKARTAHQLEEDLINSFKDDLSKNNNLTIRDRIEIMKVIMQYTKLHPDPEDIKIYTDKKGKVKYKKDDIEFTEKDRDFIFKKVDIF